MKLIKLLYKFDTPLKEDVKAFFPRDLEETLKANYILVSDAKFRLLEFAKVGMYVYHTFSEVEADDMEALFGLREEYMVIKNVIDPAEFDIDTFNPSTYDLNDYIFFYKEAPVAPEKPVAPKFHSGTFNYELTETEKKILWDAYLAKEEEYKALYEAYEEEYATFKEEELDLPIYGCLGIITRKENDIPGTILKYYDDKKLLILLDASFKTTKDVEQFGIYGKIPNGRPTLVSADIGGLKAGTSLRTWNYKEILETAFGLEPEKEYVGTIQPDGEKKKDKVTASVSYGEGKTSIGALTDTATITATFKLSEESEATNVKLMTGDTVVETKAIGDEVTFSVTGLSVTTLYKIVGYHVDAETSEEVVDSQTTATVVVNFVAPKATGLTATPASIDNTSTPVEFRVTITEGSSAISTVKLYKSDDTEVASMTPVDSSDIYGYTLNSVTATSGFYVKVVDANGSEGKSNTATVTLNIVGPNGTLTVSPTSLTAVGTVTIAATATEGSAALTKVELFVDDVLTATVTSDFTPENLTWEDDNVEATTSYKIVITDANNVTKTLTETVTFTVQNPVITMTAAPTTITTKKDDVVLTIDATQKSFALTKIELFEGASATGTALETWTTDLTTTKTKTIADVNTNKTYTVMVTDAKNNTATASASVTYNYSHPTLTVNSVTPTSTDNPITPSSVVTVSVTSTAQTGATGSTIKLYRVRSGADTLLESIAYASPASFTVNGGHADGDKFKAVVEYTADGDSYSAQKTSSPINVEVPAAPIYHINVMGIEPFFTSNSALINNEDPAVKVTTSQLTSSIVSTAINDSSLVSKGVVKSYTAIIGEISAPMSTVEVGDPDIAPETQDLIQQLFLIPQTFTYTDVTFYQNSSSASADSTMKNNHTTVTIDGVTYDAYLNGSYVAGNLTYRIVLE